MIVKQRALLTVEEAADALAISSKTVYKWIAARRLYSVRIGDKVMRIPASEVARIIEEGTIPRLRAA